MKDEMLTSMNNMLIEIMATIDRTKEENKQTLNLILTKPGVDY
jgi:hypothetical protein